MTALLLHPGHGLDAAPLHHGEAVGLAVVAALALAALIRWVRS